MTKNKIYVDLVGADYSPIDDALKNAKFYADEKREQPLENTFLSQEDLRSAFEKFLSKDKVKTFLKSQSRGSNDVPKIIDFNFKTGYFCGFVGVLNGSVEMGSEELEQNNSEEKAEESQKQGYVLNFHLQIQSRLDRCDDKTFGKPYFLSTLLLGDNSQINISDVPSGDDELYDFLLLSRFKSQLQASYLKGFYRTYRRFERNDDRLKGTIDIARHIKLNIGQNNGKIAYSYRENTVNNYLNHMIVRAYEHLKSKYYDLVTNNFDSNYDLKAIIDNLKTEIGYSEFSSYELIAKNMKPIAHPYYTEYEALRITCTRILRDDGLSVFNAEDYEVDGILVYLPDLWENYLEACMNAKGIVPKAQDEIFVFEKNGKFVQETRPDYVFKNKNDEKFMILDAKFKPKWQTTLDNDCEKFSEVKNDFDKCLRDMVDINGFATGVIFPTNNDVKLSNSKVSHKLSIHNQIVRFYTVPIYVPYSKDVSFFEWRTKFKNDVDEKMKLVSKIVKNEKRFYSKIQNDLEAIKKKRENFEFNIEA